MIRLVWSCAWRLTARMLPLTLVIYVWGHQDPSVPAFNHLISSDIHCRLMQEATKGLPLVITCQPIMSSLLIDWLTSRLCHRLHERYSQYFLQISELDLNKTQRGLVGLKFSTFIMGLYCVKLNHPTWIAHEHCNLSSRFTLING